MTRPNLDDIAKRVEAATGGPWEVNGPDERWAAISSGPDSVIHAYTEHAPDCVGCTCEADADIVISREDVEFIAHARTDVPTLLNVVRDVLALHRRDEDGECTHCPHPLDAHWRADWPCPTVRAVTAHLDITPREAP